MRHGQMEATGSAVLFESSPFAVLPDDIEESIALAALDVAGAPARTAAMVKPGDTVLLVGGGGTSGLLTLHEARKHAGPSGTVDRHRSGRAPRWTTSPGPASPITWWRSTRPIRWRSTRR